MLTYGYPVQPEKDSLVDLINILVYQFGQGTDPSVFLVDVASALEYVLAWSPGADWKLMAEKAKKLSSHRHDQRSAPFWLLTSSMLPGGEMNLTGFSRRLLVPLFLTLLNF